MVNRLLCVHRLSVLPAASVALFYRFDIAYFRDDDDFLRSGSYGKANYPSQSSYDRLAYESSRGGPRPIEVSYTVRDDRGRGSYGAPSGFK